MKILFIGLLALGSISAFAGTPDEDPVVNNIQEEFKMAPPLTEVMLRIGQEWGDCKEYSALSGSSIVKSRSPEEYGHKFIHSPRFGGLEFVTSVPTRFRGVLNLMDEGLYQAWWADVEKLSYLLTFRVTNSGHLIQESAVKNGWGASIRFIEEDGAARAAAAFAVSTNPGEGDYGYRYRLINYIVCRPL